MYNVIAQQKDCFTSIGGTTITTPGSYRVTSRRCSAQDTPLMQAGLTSQSAVGSLSHGSRDLTMIGFVWKCGVYSQWNSHLIGIMISKSIGYNGVHYFQTNPLVCWDSDPDRWTIFQRRIGREPPLFRLNIRGEIRWNLGIIIGSSATSVEDGMLGPGPVAQLPQ